MIQLLQALGGVPIRGADDTSGSLFSLVNVEDRIPARHLLRKIRQVVSGALASLNAGFEAPHADAGRLSIVSERLIRASLIQILFSILSWPQPSSTRTGTGC